MNTKFQRLKTGDLRKIARSAISEGLPTLLPSEFWHIYIKLDFQLQYENAETKSAGRTFVGNVARAASAAEVTLRSDDGVVVEVQGSVVHCLLPDDSGNINLIRRKCGALSDALHFVFNGATAVEGWRIATDWGKTLLVRGRGIHNDDSYVSLGDAANAPAKHLYAQMSISSEDDRKLKRYMVGLRRGKSTAWQHEFLSLQNEEEFKKSASFDLTDAKTKQFFVTDVFSKQAKAAPDLLSERTSVQLSATPVVQTKDDPVVYFGWAMRADLDGFTARVEECYDDDIKLLKLGQDFESIMDKAAEFAEQHAEELIQLPWAGDNFTAVVTFPDRDNYTNAIESRYIEFSLDFANALRDITTRAGLNGWAQTSAAGDINANAHGNVYVGSVTFEGRRFLIGAGQGIGRSTQAFTDLEPATGELVIFAEDRQLLLKPYQQQFTDREKPDGSDSTLFWLAKMEYLNSARQQITETLSKLNQPVKSAITVAAGTKVTVTARAYANKNFGLRDFIF